MMTTLAKVLLILAGLACFAVALVLVTIEVPTENSIHNTVSCQRVIDPDRFEPNCQPVLQTHAQGALAIGVIGVGFMVAAAAVTNRVRVVRVEGTATVPAAAAPPYQPR